MRDTINKSIRSFAVTIGILAMMVVAIGCGDPDDPDSEQDEALQSAIQQACDLDFDGAEAVEFAEERDDAPELHHGQAYDVSLHHNDHGHHGWGMFHPDHGDVAMFVDADAELEIHDHDDHHHHHTHREVDACPDLEMTKVFHVDHQDYHIHLAGADHDHVHMALVALDDDDGHDDGHDNGHNDDHDNGHNDDHNDGH